MKSERSALEQMSMASNMKMSSQKQQEIWNNIEQEMKKELPTPRTKRHRNAFTAGAVAAASVAIVGGGIYAISSHTVGPRTTVASNETVQPAVTSGYETPTSVQGIAISGDSPSAPWYFPTNVASVTQKVYTWLQVATPTTVKIPTSKNTAVLLGYVGPSRLSFTNQDGHRITVFPAYYLEQAASHVNQSVTYSTAYFQDVVAYQDGKLTTYVKSPPLYTWLKNDQWHSDFTKESSTDAGKKAIQTVLKSQWGGLFQGLFPAEPGVAACDIPHGGPAPMGKMSPLPGTCTTQAQPEGANVRVQFSETWKNGKAEHTWTFVVSAQGDIVSHTESGDGAPQFWS